ncbi:M28 family metallopeptidase [Sporobolomyces koalae]|uniref:M28 family metallopeptidase n=1 Tax=Sporobolomyces koalae TaxID=500713 RepID=UPI003170DCBB
MTAVLQLLGAAFLAAACHASPLSRPADLANVALTFAPVGTPLSSARLGCSQYLSTIGVETRVDVYYSTARCARSSSLDPLELVRLDEALDLPVPRPGEPSRLVWIHSPKLETKDLSSYVPETMTERASSQTTFSAPSSPSPPEPSLLFKLPSQIDTEEGSVYLLSPVLDVALAQLDHLTSHPSSALLTLVSFPSPNSRLTLVADEPQTPMVPKRDVERIDTWLKTLSFEPLLSALLPGIKQRSIEHDVRVLSGEDQSELKEHERWVSRHSMSTGGIAASHWLLAQMRSYDFDCTPHSYLNGFSPMLECVYNRSGKGQTANETVVLGAHYDSRGSFGFPTAPGADDDASGTSLVLAVARNIHLNRLVFSRKLVLALFSGEEQGLLGSAWYANHLKHERKEHVIWMLQVDMVGYRAPHEPPQLALPDLIGLPEAASLVGNISNIYVPELVVGRTNACCSDHSSFVDQQFAATWIFERNGPIADPCYHSSCDLSDRKGYDFEQIVMHTKVAFSTVWVVAEGRLE